jgi:hypothetical protein
LFFRAPEEKNAEQQHPWESPSPVKKRPTHRQMLGRDLWWVNIREGWKKKKTKERVRQLGDFL